MKKIKSLFLIYFVCYYSNAFGSTVDTVSIYSPSMKHARKAVIIKPDTYKKAKRVFPVVYLLHGHGGDYSNWIKLAPVVKELADRYQVLIVCPDGHSSSWYLDSPVDSSMRYETYIAKEVVEFIDRKYRTIRNRKGRAITGLSMGGHGALFIAFRNSEQFGAVGSMSGGLDLYASRNRYDLIKRIGDTVNQINNWKNFSAVHFVEKKPKDSIAILIDCGMQDYFFASNQTVHEKLTHAKIPHEFIIRPGQHNWTYWTNAVEYHFLFFRKYFETSLQ